MTDPEGFPVWYELITDAPDAARDFYGPVMGWSHAAPPAGMERDYRVFSAPDGADVAGVTKAPDGAGFAPCWAVYFEVADVDAAAARVEALGGRIHIAATDIPGIGRFAFVADPQGAIFYLMRGAGDAGSTSFAPDRPGHCSWNELVTRDQKAALDFYGALFGWTSVGAMPMGEMGDYTFIAASGTRIGAMMDAPDKAAAPFWNFAFTVADIDAAKAAIEAGGGAVTQGPMELPMEGGWLVQATDPQGAKVMFTGKRKAAA